MSARAARLLGVVALAAVVAFGTAVRVRTALWLPNFDTRSADGMLRSDPALLYYVTERIIEAGGLPPEDFRSDPRIEHPDGADVPAMFTVGQEFLVAWAYLLTGSDAPLHVFSIWVMAVVASLAGVGVYGLALELTGRVSWAVAAALLHALTPASYRTIGFVLIREDLSLPLLTLGLWLAARAARVRTAPTFAGAGLALALALATWHAMAFVVSLLAGCVLAWHLASGRNPLRVRGAWALPAVLALAALIVPVLRAKLFLLSFPMQVALALAFAAALQGRTRLPPAALGLSAWIAAAGIAWLASQALVGGTGDYRHVLELMAAKLRHLGAAPDDPSSLPFGARLLWQGPFRTGSPERLLAALYASGLLLPIAAASAVPAWLSGRGDARVAVGMAFAAVAVVAALLVHRLEVLCGLLAPVAAAAWLARRPPRVGAALMAALLAVHAVLFAGRDVSLDEWYDPDHVAELAATLAWMRENLPAEGAVAADFVHSASVLAATRHPVVLQPKYETRRSRERIERFVTTFFHAPPGELLRLLREDFRARYLLVSTRLLWASRYQAGLPDSARAPLPGTAAWFLLADPSESHARVPGFRLLYASPRPPPRFRLYELEEPGPGGPAASSEGPEAPGVDGPPPVD